jgi:hypothetical protein
MYETPEETSERRKALMEKLFSDGTPEAERLDKIVTNSRGQVVKETE